MAITTDLRHAVRLLGRSPVFTLTSIISLALGIGAAATIFSLTDALLFEPTAGVREPSRVIDNFNLDRKMTRREPVRKLRILHFGGAMRILLNPASSDEMPARVETSHSPAEPNAKWLSEFIGALVPPPGPLSFRKLSQRSQNVVAPCSTS